MAAGVISAVIPFGGLEDSPGRHFQDTIVGGLSINDRVLVKTMVNDIPRYFNRLLELGIEFDGNETPVPRFIPGHSTPRSYFIKGQGIKIQATMKRCAEALGVKFMERTLLTSLIKDNDRVVGAVGYMIGADEPVAIRSKAVVMATGGPGELYPRTLMPTGSTGYGTSLGLKAGAEVVDMEFVQFYPVMVYEEGLPQVFIDYSPLLRYGAFIENSNGDNIFKKYGVEEPFRLTRDSFSIMMAKEMSGSQDSGGERSEREKPMYLDCTAIRDGDLKENAPLATAYTNLEAKGIPLKKRKFGVSPYAHFFMGGLRADPNGATNLHGLFAAGEATGGIQGANRIGGNAFAACVVFGFRAGLAASLYGSTVDMAPEGIFIEPSSWVAETIRFNGAREASEVKFEIRRIMWEGVGILRSRESLNRALESLNSLRGVPLRSVDPAEKFLVPMMLDTAEVTALPALLREESRGSHYRLDFPEQGRDWERKIVLKLCEGKCEVKFVQP